LDSGTVLAVLVILAVVATVAVLVLITVLPMFMVLFAVWESDSFVTVARISMYIAVLMFILLSAVSAAAFVLGVFDGKLQLGQLLMCVFGIVLAYLAPTYYSILIDAFVSNNISARDIIKLILIESFSTSYSLMYLRHMVSQNKSED